jgi:hypothetical protein
MWCDSPLPYAQQVLEVLAIPDRSLLPNGGGDVGNRAAVRARLVLSCYLCAKWFGSGLEITCKPEEFARFNPPSGQTCLAWAGDFVKAAGGYLDNPNDSDSCRYCQYRVSDFDKWLRSFTHPGQGRRRVLLATQHPIFASLAGRGNLLLLLRYVLPPS